MKHPPSVIKMKVFQNILTNFQFSNYKLLPLSCWLRGKSSLPLLAMSNKELYTSGAGHRSGAGGLPAHIRSVHGGRDDSGNYQVYAVVVKGRVTGGILTMEEVVVLKINCVEVVP